MIEFEQQSERGTVDAAPAPEHTAIVGGDPDMPSSKSTKSPAFQFYPRDFLSSSKVDDMSMTERGIYITFLSRCWLDAGLPTDMKRLAKMAKMKPQQFERLWTNGPLHECFYSKANTLQNDRLDHERKSQAEYRRKQSDNGKMGGRPRKSGGLVVGISVETQPKATESSVSASASSTASASAKEQEISSEPLRDSEPSLLTFPTSGKVRSWDLTQTHVDKWHGAYPSLDILSECRRAQVWADANGHKTAKGMPAFLVRWMNQAVDRGRRVTPFQATGTDGRGRTGAAPAGKYDGFGES